MKKLTLMMLFTLALTATAVAQTDDFAKTYVGIRFLPTFTNFNINPNNNPANQTDFTLGYGYEGLVGYNITRNIAVQGEAQFNQLNQKYIIYGEQNNLQLDYINVPILLVLNTDVSRPVNYNICIGPQLGFNTGATVTPTSSNANTSDIVNTIVVVKPVTLGAAYGAGVDIKLNSQLSLDFGYRGVIGLVDISTNNQTNENSQTTPPATTNNSYSIEHGPPPNPTSIGLANTSSYSSSLAGSTYTNINDSPSLITSNYYPLQRSKISTYGGYVGLTFRF